MTKVAIVSSSFPPLSSCGVSSAQYGMFKVLQKHTEFDVKGFTFNDSVQLDYNEEKIIRSGTPNWIKKYISILFILLYKIIDRGKITYQTSNIFICAIGSLHCAFKLRKYKPDIIIISDHGAPMYFIYHFVKADYIWVAHHNPMRFVNNPLLGNMSLKDAMFATKIDNYCIKKCKCVITPSKYMEETMKQTNKVGKISYVMPNILDIDYLESIAPYKVDNPDEFKIFIPSAGSIIKGERYISVIIQWISSTIKDKNIIYLLSGNVSDSLRYEISHMSLDIKVIMLQEQEYTKNIAYLKASDLCISPTLLENFGMAILEALLSGVPVVSFDVGGNKEIIVNGKNGYIVKYLNIAALCDRAIELIKYPLTKNDVILATKEIYQPAAIEKELVDLILMVGKSKSQFRSNISLKK